MASPKTASAASPGRCCVGYVENDILVGVADIVEPLARNAVGEKFFVCGVCQQRRLLWRGLVDLNVSRNLDLLDALANLDQLCGARFGMGF